jgi:FtsH-binding integral membrane protein
MAYGYGYQQANSANDTLAQASANTFMARVFRWMFGGLALTGLTAMYVASQPALAMKAAEHMWLLFGGELAMVFGLSFFAHKMSGALAATLFLAYALLNGLTFSTIFFVFQLGSIVNAFFLTAAVFGAMSIYGTYTKRDLSSWRGFLYGGLFGIVGAMILGIFIHSNLLQFLINVAMVVVFTGLAAYDQQKLRKFHASSGYSSALSLAITGALMLYLDFINLFIALLQLFGDRRR